VIGDPPFLNVPFKPNFTVGGPLSQKGTRLSDGIERGNLCALCGAQKRRKLRLVLQSLARGPVSCALKGPPVLFLPKSFGVAVRVSEKFCKSFFAPEAVADTRTKSAKLLRECIPSFLSL